jgi:hypothetical protein
VPTLLDPDGKLARYNVSSTNGTLTVMKAPITVAAVNDEKYYDGTTHSTGVPIITSGSLVNGDTAVFTQAFNSKDVLTARLLIPSGLINDGNGGNNYVLTFVSISTDSILPAPLTLTAHDASRVYGEPNPAFSFSYSGFVPGEDENVMSGAPSLSTTAEASSPVSGSPYPITVAANTLSNPNYSLHFVNGTLTITPASTMATVSSDQWSVPPTSNVTFTVSASALEPSTASPSGTVQFVANGTNNLGSPVALTNGQTTLTILGSALLHGSNTISVVFADTNGNFLGCSGDLNPGQVVNTRPNKATHGLGAVINTPFTFAVAQLLGLDKDVDSDTLVLSEIDSAGTNGGSVQLDGNTITYTPPQNYVGNDSFTYAIADPFGGETNCTINVTVRLGTATSAINHVYPQPDGNMKLVAFGMPGKTYIIQASTDTVNWTFLTADVVPMSSVIIYYDLTATNYPSRFYRLQTMQ